MASLNDITSLTTPKTPAQAPDNHSTPPAQRFDTNQSFDFESAPVAKMEMSPPNIVTHGKGTGHVEKGAAFTAGTLSNDSTEQSLVLASPIFSHGPQYPAVNGNISEDTMEGVEETSSSGSDTVDHANAEDAMEEALMPNINNASQTEMDLEGVIQIEWIGTSTFFVQHNLELQGAVSLSRIPLRPC